MRGLLESKYTIELRYLYEDKNFKIFDFDYDFYDNDLKQQFEKKFIDYFYFHEIGAETIGRWKQLLKTHLNTIAPYYKQLYFTELESKKCNFLLNKDLKETFVRDLNGNHENTSSSENVSTSNSTDITSNNTDFQESNIDNGLASLSMDNLTNISKSNDTGKSTSNNNNNSTNRNNYNGSNNENESTTLISQGNIGVTSSGQLLEDWRKILINIDELIIKSCTDLFIMVY